MRRMAGDRCRIDGGISTAPLWPIETAICGARPTAEDSAAFVLQLALQPLDNPFGVRQKLLTAYLSGLSPLQMHHLAALKRLHLLLAPMYPGDPDCSPPSPLARLARRDHPQGDAEPAALRTPSGHPPLQADFCHHPLTGTWPSPPPWRWPQTRLKTPPPTTARHSADVTYTPRSSACSRVITRPAMTTKVVRTGSW